MLFISLPCLHLLLKLLYVRRKQFYYVDHGIFAVHLYIFSFLILLDFFRIERTANAVPDGTGIDWLYIRVDYLSFCLLL